MIGCRAFPPMLARARFQRLQQECRQTFVLALPVVVGQLLTIALNIIDTALAGHLSTDVLAAVSQGYQGWVAILLVIIGVLLAVTPAVAQLDGAGRRGEVGSVFRQALWLGLGLGTALFFVLRGSTPLLRAAGVAPSIVDDASAFLDAISWGAPALAIFFVCKNTSEGLSLTRPTMYVSALGVVVIAPVAWALMYGRLGLPALGARGAGYAHATVVWTQAFAYLAILRYGRAYEGARLFERLEPPDLARIGRLLAVGVPMGFSIVMEGGLFVASAWFIGAFGPTAASAHAVAINVASTTFMLPLGIGMATTVRVGNAVGRRDPHGVAWAGAAGFALVLATQLVSATALFAFPERIAAVYTADAEVVGLAVSLLGLAAIFQFSDGIQALFNGALRGLEDTLVPAVITCVSYWAIGMSLGWWMGRELGQGPAGFWKGFIAGLTAAAVLLGLRFVLRARKMVRSHELVTTTLGVTRESA